MIDNRKENLFVEKTNVKIEFSIFTNKNTFNPEDITKKIGIEPTNYYKEKKKISVKEDKVYSIEETCWELSTEYEECDDINYPIGKMLNKIVSKKEEIKEINKMDYVNTMFMIVIYVKNGVVPSLWLNKDFIKFASEINAEIHFDFYYR